MQKSLVLLLLLGIALDLGVCDNAGSSYSSNCRALAMNDGCVFDFGMQFGCPYSRYAEVSMTVGSITNAKSDNVQLTISFLDASNDELGSFYVSGSRECDWHEEKKIDTLKVCSSWVPRVKKIRLSAGGSDGLFIAYLQVVAGNDGTFKRNFWMDKPLQPANQYQGYPAYDDLIVQI